MIVSGLISFLETQSNVTALLAYHPRDRGSHAIYANVVPERSSRPCLIVRIRDGEDTRSFKGDHGLSDAIVDVEIQTEESQGYSKLEQIREELRLSLTNTGATWGGVEVQSCKLNYLVDTDFPPPEKANDRIHQGGWELELWFEQTPILT